MKTKAHLSLLPGSPTELGDGYKIEAVSSKRGDDGVFEVWSVFHGHVELADVTMELETYQDVWVIKDIVRPISIGSLLPSQGGIAPQHVIDELLARRNKTKKTYYVLVGMCHYSDCSDSTPKARRVPVQAHSGRGAIENLRRLVEQERDAHDGICVLGKSTHKYVGPIYTNVLDHDHKQLYGQEIEYF